MSFDSPDTPEVLALLSPEKAREVRVWSLRHPKHKWFAFHRLYNCPWIFALAYATSKHDTPAWAERVWLLYRDRHRDEGHCTCDVELSQKGSAA